jgi:hypothetical protein
MGNGGFLGRVAVVAVLGAACAHVGEVEKDGIPVESAAQNQEFVRWPVRQVRYFVPEAGCGQGPYQLRMAASESRWGQKLVVWAFTPRSLKGNVQTEMLPDDRRWHDTFGDSRADNANCVLGADEVAVPVGGQATGGGGGVATGGAGASALSMARPVVLREIPPPALPPSGRRLEVHELPLLNADHKPYPRTIVTFRIWFDEPNDLTDVVFVAATYVAELTIPEAQLVAIHARRQADEDRRQAQEDRRYAEAERRAAERSRYCNTHERDVSCWGRGGRAGFLAREERAHREEEARREQLHREEVARLERERERERQEELARRERERRYPFLRAPPAPPPPPPRTLPPAPQAESQPPRPSLHATWFAGYWRWSDEQGWLWLGGRWRVPPEDVQRDLTVHAPAPPPPPKAEAPPPPPAPPAAAPARPQPQPAVAWTPGYWQWDGRVFVWVIGSWQLLPRPGAVWSPDRWEPRGRVSVYVPGGWRVGR